MQFSDTENTLLRFHGNNSYANAPRCCVIRELPILLYCGHFTQSRLVFNNVSLNLLKTTCYVMHHQFNIQQLYALPTLYLYVLCLSENKQRLVPLTA
jgi:hypothetical protein